MGKQKITLIIPPSLFLADERVFVSLGILKVAAVLEQAGHTVEMLDLSGIDNYSEVVRSHFSNTDAAFVGITSTTPQFPYARKVIEAIREVNSAIRVCIGGPHVTAVCASYKRFGENSRSKNDFRELESLADVFVSGDGEEAIFRALEDTTSQWIDADDPETSMFLKAKDLETYPFPARHLVDLKSYKYQIDGVQAASIISQLGCPFGCVSGETLLGLPDGLFYASEASFVHRNLICGDGHIHHLGMVGGSQIVSNGRKECLKITLENGLSFTLTPEHNVLVAEKEKLEWREAGGLLAGTYLAIGAGDNQIEKEVILPPPSGPKVHNRRIYKEKEVKIPASLNADVAWLAGFLIGDGCLPKDNRPSFHFVVSPELEQVVQAKLLSCFGVAGTLTTHTLTEKVKHLWVHSSKVRRFFVECVGINPNDKLHVPFSIRQSPPYIVKNFLNGLWTADGHTPKDGSPSYLTTISGEFAQEVANLVLWIGHGTSIVGPIIQKNTLAKSGFLTYWRVNLCEDRCWADKKGKPCWTSVVPTDNRRIYRSRKSGRLLWRTRTGRTRSSVTRALLNEIAPNHPLLANKYLYVPVRRIEKVGDRNVYDLAVEGTHRFSANGVIVHNCSFCGMRMSPSFRRVRIRSSISVVNEMRQIYEEYGFRGFFFLDDELNVNPNFLNDLKAIGNLQQELGVEFALRGFIKSNLFNEAQAKTMKEVGFRQILIGFEAAADRILLNIKKKATLAQNTRCMEIAHKYGLKVKALMSTGHPGESRKTVEAIHDWLVNVEPADFDITTITTYPSTPYFDLAKQVSDNVWAYTAENGDKLYSYDVDFSRDGSYYKGVPGEYKSYVFTDHLSADELVKMRDWVEKETRHKLNIPFYHVSPASRFEASMGQLPGHIYRTSTPNE